MASYVLENDDIITKISVNLACNDSFFDLIIVKYSKFACYNKNNL